MRNNFKKLLLSSLVALFALTGIATTASASTLTTESSVKEKLVEIQAIPKSQSVNITRVYGKYSYPPSKIYYTLKEGGVKYTGYISRTGVVDTAEHYLASYAGVVYR